jgi:hypothetical protein
MQVLDLDQLLLASHKTVELRRHEPLLRHICKCMRLCEIRLIVK